VGAFVEKAGALAGMADIAGNFAAFIGYVNISEWRFGIYETHSRNSAISIPC
jgi:hypothetical protein